MTIIKLENNKFYKTNFKKIKTKIDNLVNEIKNVTDKQEAERTHLIRRGCGLRDRMISNLIIELGSIYFKKKQCKLIIKILLKDIEYDFSNCFDSQNFMFAQQKINN